MHNTFVLEAAGALRDALRGAEELAPVGPIAYILNPLEYAWEAHAAYIRRFTREGRCLEAVFVGMNPGPFGMAQTGIPFGSPDLVRDFLQIDAPIRQPLRTHPKRPIEGIHSRRTEVSGQRLWGAIRDCFGSPDPFFERFYVANYCPLVFQAESGANLTPDKIPPSLRAAWEPLYQAHLSTLILALKPNTVIGVGRWATQQAQRAVETSGYSCRINTILHPSPASPAANQDWRGQVLTQLSNMGHSWPIPSPGGDTAR